MINKFLFTLLLIGSMVQAQQCWYFRTIEVQNESAQVQGSLCIADDVAVLDNGTSKLTLYFLGGRDEVIAGEQVQAYLYQDPVGEVLVLRYFDSLKSVAIERVKLNEVIWLIE